MDVANIIRFGNTMLLNISMWSYILFNIYKAYIYMTSYKKTVTIDPLETFKKELQEDIRTLDLRLVLQEKAIDASKVITEDAVKKLHTELATLKVAIQASTQDTMKKLNYEMAEFKIASEASLQEYLMKQFTDKMTALKITSEASQKTLPADITNIPKWLGSRPYLTNCSNVETPSYLPLHTAKIIKVLRERSAANTRSAIEKTVLLLKD
jgi:hypothetical protein